MKQQNHYPPHYRTFILRCWQEDNPDMGLIQWRFSLQEVGSPRRAGFAEAGVLSNHLLTLFGEKTGEELPG
jgi:hypothetical protein